MIDGKRGVNVDKRPTLIRHNKTILFWNFPNLTKVQFSHTTVPHRITYFVETWGPPVKSKFGRLAPERENQKKKIDTDATIVGPVCLHISRDWYRWGTRLPILLHRLRSFTRVQTIELARLPAIENLRHSQCSTILPSLQQSEMCLLDVRSRILLSHLWSKSTRIALSMSLMLHLRKKLYNGLITCQSTRIMSTRIRDCVCPYWTSVMAMLIGPGRQRMLIVSILTFSLFYNYCLLLNLFILPPNILFWFLRFLKPLQHMSRVFVILARIMIFLKLYYWLGC